MTRHHSKIERKKNQFPRKSSSFYSNHFEILEKQFLLLRCKQTLFGYEIIVNGVQFGSINFYTQIPIFMAWIHWTLTVFLLLFTEYKIIRKKRTDFNSFCETLNDMQHPIAFKNKWQTINMHFYVSPIRNNYFSVDFEMWFLFVCASSVFFFGKKKVQKMSQNPNQYKILDLMFVCFIEELLYAFNYIGTKWINAQRSVRTKQIFNKI